MSIRCLAHPLRRAGVLAGTILVLATAAGARADAALPESAPAMNTSSTFVPPHDPRLQYMGRFAFGGAGPDEARLGFPGVTVRFAYRGPAPTILLGAQSAFCAFNLSVNGWEPVVIRLPEGASELPLPSGPAPAAGWVVELVRRNESWQGVAAFRGLQLPPGCTLLAPPPLPARRLLVIGDSITGGERIDRFPPELDDTQRTANAARSYGMLLARRFGAQVHLVSYGGRGVLRSWEARTDVANAPAFFELALPDDPSAKWDHARYQPDAIVVALGQNDLSPGWIEESVFTDAFARFVAQLRAAHPHAAILLTESPMRGLDPATEDGRKREFQRRCLRTVIAARQAAGDARIAFAPLGHYPGTPTNAHPVAFQHEQMAEELAGPLRQLAGW